MSPWPFHGLKRKHYGAALIDPPWTYATFSDKGKGRSPEKHYSCMSLDDIKALPVRDLLQPNAVVLMWTIDTHLRQSMEVLDAWGLTFKTVGFYWAKTNRDGSPFTGMGHWTRANPEQCWLAVNEDGGSAWDDRNQCLLATVGSPSRQAKDVRRLIMSPRREHSRKPDELHERIERLVPGPYCELFARQRRPGWDCWGDQIERFPARKIDLDLDDLLGGPINRDLEELV